MLLMFNAMYPSLQGLFCQKVPRTTSYYLRVLVNWALMIIWQIYNIYNYLAAFCGTKK